MDLIIDGNAYLNVSLSVIRSMLFKDKSIGAKYYVNDIFNDNGVVLKEQVKVQFRNFCLNYLHSIIAPVEYEIDRVHMVFDSRSWRKEYIRNFFADNDFETDLAPSEFEYKGNRKKSSEDHTYLFFDYFQQEIIPALVDRSGVNYYRIKGTEGDDIIAYLCETIKNDVLIYTVDGDIRQMVHSDNKNVILIYPKQMAKHKKMFVPSEFIPDEAEEEEDNFFSLSESHIVKSKIDRMISKLKSKEYVEYTVDPVFEIFDKIFRGDKKDNVPKMDKMTPTKSSKLIEEIREKYGKSSIDLLDQLDESFILFLIDRIKLLNKISEETKILETKKHLLFNTKIIRLSSAFFPDEVKESCISNVDISRFKNFNFRKFNDLKNNPHTI